MNRNFNILLNIRKFLRRDLIDCVQINSVNISVFFWFFSLLIVIQSCHKEERLSFVSPGGNIRVLLNTDAMAKNEGLTYDVEFNDLKIINNGRLGLEFNNLNIPGRDFRVVSGSDTVIDEQYHMPHGKASKIRNQYHQYFIKLGNKDGIELGVEFRIYNDGIGFR